MKAAKSNYSACPGVQRARGGGVLNVRVLNSEVKNAIGFHNMHAQIVRIIEY